jgi:hypothetical protein
VVVLRSPRQPFHFACSLSQDGLHCLLLCSVVLRGEEKMLQQPASLYVN